MYLQVLEAIFEEGTNAKLQNVRNTKVNRKTKYIQTEAALRRLA